MRATLPFRWKIALMLTLISGVVLAGVAVGTLSLVRGQKTERIDVQIQALASRLPANPAGRGGARRLEESMAWILGGERAYLVVFDLSGREVFRSPDWPDEHIIGNLEKPAGMDYPEAGNNVSQSFYGGRGAGPGSGQVVLEKLGYKTVTTAAGAWRVGGFLSADACSWVAVSLAPLESDMGRLRARYIMILLPALALMAASGWYVSGRALQPLNNIARTAERIGGGGLFPERIPRAEHAPEIDRIIGVLNSMLERLEKSYQQALRFSADASHELKTPLAILQGTVEEALRTSGSDPERQQWCLQLMDEIFRLKRITGNLLLLARKDAGRLDIDPQEFELSGELDGLLEDAGALRDPPVEIVLNIPGEVSIVTDRTLFRTVLMNLLGNAVKYTEPAAGVTVDVARTDTQVFISITNGGAGIAKEDQPHVFNRFYRGVSGKGGGGGGTDGHGLGLSLAAELAQAISAKVELAESRPGLTRFTFTCPVRVARQSVGGDLP